MPAQQLDPEQQFVLDAAFGRLEAARRAVEQARRELGAAMRSVGLSASARHLDRSRQWALQLAQEAEGPRNASAQAAPKGDDLADSIRRLGIVEPIVVEAIDDEFLKVLDGHRRLRAAREAGLTSLPVSLLLGSRDREHGAPPAAAAETGVSAVGPAEPQDVSAAEAAVREHRRVCFLYRGLEGDPRRRTVDVWGLVWRSGMPYLVGFDHERAAIRTFRIDRILDGVEDVGEGSPPPEGFSAERNVWSQLDPEVVKAMRAMSRVFQELSRREGLEDWLDLARDLEPEAR